MTIRRTVRRALRRLGGPLHGDQAGQVTLEWALVLAAIALPLLYVFTLCLKILVAQYRMMTFMNSMPFP